METDWGTIIGGFAPWLAVGLALGLGWAFTRVLASVSPDVSSVLKTMQVEQLLGKAIAYGINATAGAAKDKQFTIDTGYPALTQMLVYALVHGPEWLEQWAGTPDQLAQKLWARLDVEPDVPAPDFVSIAANAKVQAVAQTAGA